MRLAALLPFLLLVAWLRWSAASSWTWAIPGNNTTSGPHFNSQLTICSWGPCDVDGKCGVLVGRITATGGWAVQVKQDARCVAVAHTTESSCVVTEQSRLVCAQAADGNLGWQRRLPGTWRLCGASAPPSDILVVWEPSRGAAEAISSDGRPLWSSRGQWSSLSGVLHAGASLLLLGTTTEGSPDTLTVANIRTTTSQPIWKLPLPQQLAASGGALSLALLEQGRTALLVVAATAESRRESSTDRDADAATPTPLLTLAFVDVATGRARVAVAAAVTGVSQLLAFGQPLEYGNADGEPMLLLPITYLPSETARDRRDGASGAPAGAAMPRAGLIALHRLPAFGAAAGKGKFGATVAVAAELRLSWRLPSVSSAARTGDGAQPGWAQARQLQQELGDRVRRQQQLHHYLSSWPHSNSGGSAIGAADEAAPAAPRCTMLDEQRVAACLLSSAPDAGGRHDGVAASTAVVKGGGSSCLVLADLHSGETLLQRDYPRGGGSDGGNSSSSSISARAASGAGWSFVAAGDGEPATALEAVAVWPTGSGDGAAAPAAGQTGAACGAGQLIAAVAELTTAVQQPGGSRVRLALLCHTALEGRAPRQVSSGAGLDATLAPLGAATDAWDNEGEGARTGRQLHQYSSGFKPPSPRPPSPFPSPPPPPSPPSPEPSPPPSPPPPFPPSPQPPSPYACPAAMPGRTPDRVAAFFNMSNLLDAERETAELDRIERIPKLLPSNITVTLACNISNIAPFEVHTLLCSYAATKRVGGGATRPTAANGTTLSCAVQYFAPPPPPPPVPPVGGLSRPPPRPPAPWPPTPPPATEPYRNTMLSCVATMNSNGTTHMVSEGLEPLTSFDPTSLGACVRDPFPTRQLNTTQVYCSAVTTPSPVDVPSSRAALDTRMSCERFFGSGRAGDGVASGTADGAAEGLQRRLSALLGADQPLQELTRLMCPSPPCGRPAAAALDVLAGFSRRANIDADLKVFSPPPPQLPSRRVSPPPPSPPAPKSLDWVILFDPASSFCLDLAIHMPPPGAFTPQPPPPVGVVAPPPAPPPSARSLPQLFSSAFGGWNVLPGPEARVCTPVGYKPYRMAHLSAAGAGLSGDLGLDILRDPLLLADGVPVSNLISIDLSRNAIGGQLPNGPANASAAAASGGFTGFSGYDFPCLFWNFSRNRIGGSIPAGFYLHSALLVDLSYNHLSGGLPENWTLLETAVVLDLTGNNLTGPLPLSWATDLGPSANRTTRRDYTGLRRRLDEGRSDMDRGGLLGRLMAYGTQLYGRFRGRSGDRVLRGGREAQRQQQWRQERRRQRELQQIGTSTGAADPPPPAPPPPARPTRERGMHSLRLGGNSLSGPLPAGWLTLAVAELDLSNNMLTGEVPSDWSGVASMRLLDLSNNAGLRGTVSSIALPDLLRAVKISGTQVQLHPEAVLQGMPRAALWVAVVDAVLRGRLALANVQRPELRREDLGEICAIYRSYRSYLMRGEEAPRADLHGVTDTVTLGRGLAAASRGPAAGGGGGAPPAMPMFGLMAEFAAWVAGGPPGAAPDDTAWLARPDEWCYGHNVAALLRLVLGLWLPVAAVLVAMLLPIPCYYYWHRRDERLAQQVVKKADNDDDGGVVHVASRAPLTAEPSFATRLVDRLNVVASSQANQANLARYSVEPPATGGGGGSRAPAAAAAKSRSLFGRLFGRGKDPPPPAASTGSGQQAATGGEGGAVAASAPAVAAEDQRVDGVADARQVAGSGGGSGSGAAAPRAAAALATTEDGWTRGVPRLSGGGGPTVMAMPDSLPSADFAPPPTHGTLTASSVLGWGAVGPSRASLTLQSTGASRMALHRRSTGGGGGGAAGPVAEADEGDEAPVTTAGRGSLRALLGKGSESGGSGSSRGVFTGGAATAAAAAGTPARGSRIAALAPAPITIGDSRPDMSTPISLLTSNALDVASPTPLPQRTKSRVIQAGPRLPIPDYASEPESPSRERYAEDVAVASRRSAAPRSARGANGGSVAAAAATPPPPIGRGRSSTAQQQQQHSLTQMLLPEALGQGPRPMSHGGLGLVAAMQSGGSAAAAGPGGGQRLRSRRYDVTTPTSTPGATQDGAAAAAVLPSLRVPRASGTSTPPPGVVDGPLSGLLTGRSRRSGLVDLPPELMVDPGQGGRRLSGLAAGARGGREGGDADDEDEGRGGRQGGRPDLPPAAGIPAIATLERLSGGGAVVLSRPGSGGARGSGLAARSSTGAVSAGSAEELTLPAPPADAHDPMTPKLERRSKSRRLRDAAPTAATTTGGETTAAEGGEDGGDRGGTKKRLLRQKSSKLREDRAAAEGGEAAEGEEGTAKQGREKSRQLDATASAKTGGETKAAEGEGVEAAAAAAAKLERRRSRRLRNAAKAGAETTIAEAEATGEGEGAGRLRKKKSSKRREAEQQQQESGAASAAAREDVKLEKRRSRRLRDAAIGAAGTKAADEATTEAEIGQGEERGREKSSSKRREEGGIVADATAATRGEGEEAATAAAAAAAAAAKLERRRSRKSRDAAKTADEATEAEGGQGGEKMRKKKSSKRREEEAASVLTGVATATEAGTLTTDTLAEITEADNDGGAGGKLKRRKSRKVKEEGASSVAVKGDGEEAKTEEKKKLLRKKSANKRREEEAEGKEMEAEAEGGGEHNGDGEELVPHGSRRAWEEDASATANAGTVAVAAATAAETEKAGRGEKGKGGDEGERENEKKKKLFRKKSSKLREDGAAASTTAEITEGEEAAGAAKIKRKKSRKALDDGAAALAAATTTAGETTAAEGDEKGAAREKKKKLRKKSSSTLRTESDAVLAPEAATTTEGEEAAAAAAKLERRRSRKSREAAAAAASEAEAGEPGAGGEGGKLKKHRSRKSRDAKTGDEAKATEAEGGEERKVKRKKSRKLKEAKEGETEGEDGKDMKKKKKKSKSSKSREEEAVASAAAAADSAGGARPPPPPPPPAVAAAMAANAAAAAYSDYTSDEYDDDDDDDGASSYTSGYTSASAATSAAISRASSMSAPRRSFSARSNRSLRLSYTADGAGSRRAWDRSRRGSLDLDGAIAPPPEPQLMAVGPPPPPPPKPRKQRTRRHVLEYVCICYWALWEAAAPRVAALVYLLSLATDVGFIAAYVDPWLSPAPPAVVGAILLFYFTVSWAVRLRVAWGFSLRAAVLLAPLTLPFGLPYELAWDVLTLVLAFLLGSPDLLNGAVRACALTCCGTRPGCFSLATNLRTFRVKLLLEALTNALPQAFAQATFYMVAYRSGFVISPVAYMLSAAASAASLLRAAAALHYFAYAGVPLWEALRQRGRHFNQELVQLDALEDIKDMEAVISDDKEVNAVHRVLGLRAASFASRVRVAPEDGMSVRDAGTSALPSLATTAAPSPAVSRPSSGGKRSGADARGAEPVALAGSKKASESGAVVAGGDATRASSTVAEVPSGGTGASAGASASADSSTRRPASASAGPGTGAVPEIGTDEEPIDRRRSASSLGPLPPIVRGGPTSSGPPSRVGSARKGDSADGGGGQSNSLAAAASAVLAAVGAGVSAAASRAASRTGSARLGSGRSASGRSRSANGLPGGRLRFAASVKAPEDSEDSSAGGAGAGAAAAFGGPTGRYGNHVPKPSAPNAFYGSSTDRPEYHFQQSPIGMLTGAVSAKTLAASKLRSKSANARTAAESAATVATLAASEGAGAAAQPGIYGGVGSVSGMYGAYATPAATPYVQLTPPGTAGGMYGSGSAYGAGSLYSTGTLAAASVSMQAGAAPIAYDPALYQQYAAYYAAMQQQYVAAAAANQQSLVAPYAMATPAEVPGAVPVRSSAGLTEMPGVVPYEGQVMTTAVAAAAAAAPTPPPQ